MKVELIFIISRLFLIDIYRTEILWRKTNFCSQRTKGLIINDLLWPLEDACLTHTLFAVFVTDFLKGSPFLFYDVYIKNFFFRYVRKKIAIEK